MEKTYENGYYDVSEEALENEKNLNSGNTSNYNNQVVFDTKNYLNVRLEKGESTRTVRIRLLPFPETKSPFLHIYMHTIKVPLEISKSGWKSYVCLKHTEGLDENLGKKCPFCEKASEAFKHMKEITGKTEAEKALRDSYKQEGKDHLEKEVVIMRCIERGKEDEGVKFWKVNVHATKKDDPYNLIYTLWETRKAEWLADKENEGRDPKESNILSINDYGYDLNITMKKEVKVNENGKEEEKTTYQVMDAKKPSALSNDPEQAKAWVFDNKKWSDVFVPKPYDYLKIVIDGKIPFYDKENQKWVRKMTEEEKKKAEEEKAREYNEAVKKAEEALTKEPAQAPAPAAAPAPATEKKPEDDLPF